MFKRFLALMLLILFTNCNASDKSDIEEAKAVFCVGCKKQVEDLDFKQLKCGCCYHKKGCFKKYFLLRHRICFGCGRDFRVKLENESGLSKYLEEHKNELIIIGVLGGTLVGTYYFLCSRLKGLNIFNP